jgi:pSer/pThr/pTyr-binding forkhead associated (FHA) protein
VTGEQIALDRPALVLGRSSDCDIVLKAPEVSRRHCRIECVRDEVTVEDLGSALGTRVNGVPIRRALLRDGDRLEIAREVFQVRLQPRRSRDQNP